MAAVKEEEGCLFGKDQAVDESSHHSELSEADGGKRRGFYGCFSGFIPECPD